MNRLSPIPDNEIKRLERLTAYEILDTGPEEAFDRITRVAQHIFDAPIALVSLVDENRQWFKSCLGLDVSETPRGVAFCAHAIVQNEMLIITDATQDSRFADNPLVTGGPKIRFYAGAQLRTADGLGLGTLCVIDTKPRAPTQRQFEDLRDLADLAMDALNLRRAGQITQENAQQIAGLTDLQAAFIDSVNHELRNPLMSIAGSLDLLAGGVVGELTEETRDYILMAERNSNRLVDLISDLLDFSKLDRREVKFDFASFDLAALTQEVVENHAQNARLVALNTETPQLVYGDRARLKHTILNVVKNALIFSPDDTSVFVSVTATVDDVGLEICDLGRGIPAQQRRHVFKNFAKLTDSTEHPGNGLGLSIAKSIVEGHGGDISIRANAPQGTCVSITLPRSLITQDQQSAPDIY